MHTTLQGQKEICRYLERGIKQQSLINTVYRAGQKKKTNRKRQRQRAHGWLEINTQKQNVSSYRQGHPTRI